MRQDLRARARKWTRVGSTNARPVVEYDAAPRQLLLMEKYRYQLTDEDFMHFSRLPFELFSISYNIIPTS